jgi:hypothetical protein
VHPSLAARPMNEFAYVLIGAILLVALLIFLSPYW